MRLVKTSRSRLNNWGAGLQAWSLGFADGDGGVARRCDDVNHEKRF